MNQFLKSCYNIEEDGRNDHMSIYLIPIQTAILLFPILAALFTIPYVIHQYRKYGSVIMLRVGIIYSFIFYLLCAYFLVIMPLPPMEDVAHYTGPTMQLMPFKSLLEFSTTTSLVLDDPSTYVQAFNEPSMYLIVFNVFLTIPFGVFLRYYVRCSWLKTLFCTFFFTLSFECIQLSALFGIYPRPYRLFDVDDLITNTLGGMIGYVITPIFSHVLPTRARLDQQAYEKGREVTVLRRIFAFLIDICFLLGITFIVTFLSKGLNFEMMFDRTIMAYFYYVIAVVIFICLLPMFTQGKTIGKLVVRIYLVQCNNKTAKWYHFILHSFIFYCFILPLPYIIFLLFRAIFLNTLAYERFLFVCTGILIIFYIICMIQAFNSLFEEEQAPWYKKVLKNKSSVVQRK